MCAIFFACTDRTQSCRFNTSPLRIDAYHFVSTKSIFRCIIIKSMFGLATADGILRYQIIMCRYRWQALSRLCENPIGFKKRRFSYIQCFPSKSLAIFRSLFLCAAIAVERSVQPSRHDGGCIMQRRSSSKQQHYAQRYGYSANTSVQLSNDESTALSCVAEQ